MSRFFDKLTYLRRRLAALVSGRRGAATLLAGSCLMTTAGCATRQREAATEPWNVLLIVVDTLRADHLELYGYDRSTAPFLQSFARRGTTFLQARSQAGCTFLSVNSFLTSKPPQIYLQTMKEHGWGIPEAIPSLPTVLHSNGYRTAAVSASPIVRKNPGPQNPDGGFGDGFDLFIDDCERKPASCINQGAYDFLDEGPEPFFLYLHYFEPSPTIPTNGPTPTRESSPPGRARSRGSMTAA